MFKHIYLDTGMTKTVSLRDEAYRRLASLKREGESFSDLVERLTEEKVPEYADLAGVLSGETLEEIRRERENRKERGKAEVENSIERLERT